MDIRPNTDAWQTHRVVLDLLIQDYPAPWGITELSRVVAGEPLASDTTEPPTNEIEDAVRDLYGAGLVHRIGGLYVASRAAVEGARFAAR